MRAFKLQSHHRVTLDLFSLFLGATVVMILTVWGTIHPLVAALALSCFGGAGFGIAWIIGNHNCNDPDCKYIAAVVTGAETTET